MVGYTWQVIAILAITFVVSMMLSPADPISFLFEWFAMSVTGLGAFGLGVSSGKKRAASQ